MKRQLHPFCSWIYAFVGTLVLTMLPFPAKAQEKKPNIVVIMGDDIGIWNIGAYHHGMMAGRTPNLDKLAAEGMLFTDYYAEASCTAGRAAFITGELPIRKFKSRSAKWASAQQCAGRSLVKVGGT